MSESAPTFDEERAAAYDDRIRRLAPGYDVLHDLIASLAATQLADDANVLVVGAGTGEEIVRLGRAQPGWRFTAVDPSAEMLERCQERVAEAGMSDRVTHVQERVEDLPPDAHFDGATSIFVAHFLQDPAVKRRYFRAIARRLRPGAPLLLADLFAGPSAEAFDALVATWRRALRREGLSADEVEHVFDRMDRQIDFVAEEALSQILADAGLGTPTRFYQHLLWGGWWTQKTQGDQ
jgi:tRNA (cmo5U34)-methyltransferase